LTHHQTHKGKHSKNQRNLTQYTKYILVHACTTLFDTNKGLTKTKTTTIQTVATLYLPNNSQPQDPGQQEMDTAEWLKVVHTIS